MNSDHNENPEDMEFPQDESLAQYAAPASSDEHNSDLVEAALVKIRPQKLTLSGKLAWVFVIAATLFMFSVVAYSQVTTAPQVGGDADAKDLMQIQLSGKAIVGQRRLLESQSQPIPSSAKIVPEEFDTGSYEQRLCYAILVNEVEGADEAVEYLEKLEQKVQDNELTLTEDQQQMRDALTGLFADYEQGVNEPQVNPNDQTLIEKRLEWIGQLAFVPKGTSNEAARKKVLSKTTEVMVASIGGVIVGGLMGVIGIGLAVTFFAFVMSGKINFRFAPRNYNHSIYIETFAIWMALFFGSSIVFGLIGIRSPMTAMAIQPFVFFGSLVALAWPVFRGIPFRQVKADIGWTADNPLLESASAIPSYLATLPLLIPGVILLSVLTRLIVGFHEPHEFARPFMPGHPVQDYISSGGIPMILLVFLTACVAAPIVEETMFRGVLYRHLRDVSAGWKRTASILFSALLNGLIFASIHPQGIYGIPVLATLAVGFSLAREWRGSLISSMVMHFVHNFLITCISLLIL